ncbi:MAG: hypothetical protein Q9N34_09835 [Aquificota bacterium]|nr:hypothetical protein [Aquificota bacterium]
MSSELWLSSYVKGVTNRIALSVERVSDATPKDYTDVVLSFWYNF